MIKVHGPYYRNDGRQHVVLYDTETKKKRTVSYPKYLMEQHLGRELHPDNETVDHINGDFTDNRLENLRVISRGQHVSEDALHVDKTVTEEMQCVLCEQSVIVNVYKRQRQKWGKKAGPFCSRQCRGRYGAMLQNGDIEKLEQVQCKTPITYYKKQKS